MNKINQQFTRNKVTPIKLYGLLFLLLPLTDYAQSRYYVNQLAAGQNNGQSWSDSFNSLHDALAIAVAGDEVWVAKGTYYPSATGDRAARFEMLSGVQLYGSFAGTELDVSERDLAASPTVLDGDLGIPDDSTDNSYNLLYLYRPDSTTIVNGFTFRHALANDTSAAPGEVGSSGAALYIMAFDGAAYPLIRNCVFEHNTVRWHGGAVYVEGGGEGSVAPVFEHCAFTSNRALQGDGGALYRNGGSWVDRPADLLYCTFTDNQAFDRGGGVYFADSPRIDTFDLVHTEWNNNRVKTINNGFYLQGSGLHINHMRNDGATVLAIRSLQADNQTTGFSFIEVYDYMNLFGTQNFILQIDSVQLTNSYAITGDVLGYAQVIARNVNLINSATISVASISASPYSSYQNINIKKPYPDTHFSVNSTVAEFNKINCSEYCGHFYITNNSGGQLNVHNALINTGQLGLDSHYTSPGEIRFSNSTVLDHFSNSNFHYLNGQPKITNCILLDSTPEFFPSPYPASHPIFDHNLFNFPSALPNTSGWITTNNLWQTDPQFIQPDSLDFRLQPCSPARDAGNNAAVLTPTDLAGQPRIQGDSVDLGAYESPALGLVTAPDIKPACINTANGSISAEIVGACTPYTLTWQTGTQAGATLDSLAAGLYTVTVTDAQGRQFSFNATVPAAQAPVLYVQATPISCFGASDGVLVAQPLTGQPPFTYQWSPSGAIDSVLTGVPPGPASVTVTDAAGCTASFTFQLPEPDTLQFIAMVQNATAQQAADGRIAVQQVSGGTAPYEYMWSAGSSMDSLLQGLAPGAYTLTVTDEHGCTAAWTFLVGYTSGTVGQPAPVSLQLYPNPAVESVTVSGLDVGLAPGILELYDATGRLVRSWEWPADERTLSLAGLSTGTYWLQWKGASGQILGIGRFLKN